MRKRQIGQVGILVSKEITVKYHHRTDGGDEIGICENDAFRRAGSATGVHDDSSRYMQLYRAPATSFAKYLWIDLCQSCAIHRYERCEWLHEYQREWTD